jgi:hypothetical protein
MAYPVEIKAQAIALLQEGYGPWRVEEMMRAATGEGPGHTVINEWKIEAELSGVLRSQTVELAIRAGRRSHRILDAIDAVDPTTLTHGQLISELNATNILRGTNIDKLQRESAPPSQAINIVLIEAQRPSTQNTENPVPSPRSDMELPATYREIKEPET